MTKQYDVYQTQHRLQFNEYLKQQEQKGWSLVGPVQFQVFPDLNRTYYLATFVKEGATNDVLLNEEFKAVGDNLAVVDGGVDDNG